MFIVRQPKTMAFRRSEIGFALEAIDMLLLLSKEQMR